MKKVMTMVLLFTVLTCAAFAHPGRTDKNGGHAVSADGWGYPVGTYHYHDRNGNIVPVNKDDGVPTEISVSVDGVRVLFPDQRPVIVNDRTLVPLRAIFEALGATVEWDDAAQTVISTRGDVTVSLTIGMAALMRSGEAIALDVPAQLINDRTMVPVRAISEAFGCAVEWDDALQCVYVESPEYIAARGV